MEEMELKKYYNSKLIEQLADNIKTKFIWFLWRKQVVKLTRPQQQTTINLNFLFENEKVGLIWLIAALAARPVN